MNKNQPRDFARLTQQYQQLLTPEKLNALADSLDLSVGSLRRLSIGWDGNAYAFPMSNDFGKIIGIRRRFPSGQKASVKGSRTGLFIPSDLPAEGLPLISEGATDTAAALDLSFAATGRPNCNSGTDLVLRIAKGREVVIVGDNDDVGTTGAQKLAKVLAIFSPSVKVIYPPKDIKDLRKWLNAGLTSVELGKAISRTNPLQVTTRFKRTKTK